MIEYLESLDRALVLAVNSWNSPFWDEVMWWISARITWVPLYLLLFYLAYRKDGLKTAFLFLVFTALTIIIADAISVYAIKETVQRYRPSHHALLHEHLHFYKTSPKDFYMGGDFGFVSSHATNFFAVATCFCLVYFKAYRKMSYTLFLIAAIICYSRMYLGVHYLSDLIGGAILGTFVALLMYKFVWLKVVKNER